MVDKNEVARLLTEAADLIEPEGAWTKGSFTRPNPDAPDGWSYCALGAMRAIRDQEEQHALDEEYNHAFLAVDNRIQELVSKRDDVTCNCGCDNITIDIFNDHPSTTQQEMVDILRTVGKQIAQDEL